MNGSVKIKMPLFGGYYYRKFKLKDQSRISMALPSRLVQDVCVKDCFKAVACSIACIFNIEPSYLRDFQALRLLVLHIKVTF
jgi:hypothetical protein